MNSNSQQKFSFKKSLLSAVLALSSLTCQSYDFEPVVPNALAQRARVTTLRGKPLKPNLMLVVDRSGSMIPRMNEMKSAMSRFLGGFASDPVARVGLQAYPINDGCTPAQLSNIQREIPSSEEDGALISAANSVRDQISSLAAAGGTPTGQTLAALANYAPLQEADRANFVLLLTDGLPNCNDAAAKNNCDGATQCNVLCNSPSYRPGDGCCTGDSLDDCQGARARCAGQCLDDDGALSAIGVLRSKGIQTIVIGFGADLLAGAGPSTLNAMAQAGGFARTCPGGRDDECGRGNSCDQAQKLCTKKFYQAVNADELSSALAEIGRDLISDPCTWSLDQQPSDPALLSVLVDDVAIPSGPTTWQYSAGKVAFTDQGEVCQKLRKASTSAPVKVEFRVIEVI